MKASKALTKAITEKVQALDVHERREMYRSGQFPRADRTKDVDKRYRWDLFWLAFDQSGYDFREAFRAEDLADSHIDTILRRAVPDLSVDVTR